MEKREGGADFSRDAKFAPIFSEMPHFSSGKVEKGAEWEGLMELHMKRMTKRNKKTISGRDSR